MVEPHEQSRITPQQAIIIKLDNSIPGGLAAIERKQMLARYQRMVNEQGVLAALHDLRSGAEAMQTRDLARPQTWLENEITHDREPLGMHDLGRLITDDEYPELIERHGQLRTFADKKVTGDPTHLLMNFFKTGEGKLDARPIYETESLMPRWKKWQVRVTLPKSFFPYSQKQYDRPDHAFNNLTPVHRTDRDNLVAYFQSLGPASGRLERADMISYNSKDKHVHVTIAVQATMVTMRNFERTLRWMRCKDFNVQQLDD